MIPELIALGPVEIALLIGALAVLAVVLVMTLVARHRKL